MTRRRNPDPARFDAEGKPTAAHLANMQAVFNRLARRPENRGLFKPVPLRPRSPPKATP